MHMYRFPAELTAQTRHLRAVITAADFSRGSAVVKKAWVLS